MLWRSLIGGSPIVLLSDNPGTSFAKAHPIRSAQTSRTRGGQHLDGKRLSRSYGLTLPACCTRMPSIFIRYSLSQYSSAARSKPWGRSCPAVSAAHSTRTLGRGSCTRQALAAVRVPRSSLRRCGCRSPWGHRSEANGNEHLVEHEDPFPDTIHIPGAVLATLVASRRICLAGGDRRR